MSAIYGAIDLNGGSIDEKIADRFDEAYAKCKIDRNKRLISGNVYMHCGLQIFYPHAEAEQLPLYDEENNLYLTSDCVLDNRKKLISELGLNATTPDGEIILEAYKKWGKESLEHLEGLFSFVLYDKKKNEIFAAVDQFSQRCLFYHLRDGVFYFSTLFFPIPKASLLKFEENERWLIDCISLISPAVSTEQKETALKGIEKIICGTYITVAKEKASDYKIKEKRYYDPNATVKTDWNMTLEESEELVRKTFKEALQDVLQEQTDVAAQLSSGLDSSTVVCNAAPILAERGGKIYSYTAVPDSDAGVKNTRGILYDETDGVMKIANMYSNIVPEFVDSKGRYYLWEAEDFVETCELPCKSQQNMIWGDEISKKARERGMRIILCGSTGNCTASAGKFEDVIYYYLGKLDFRKVNSIFNVFRDNGISRKRFFKALLKRHFGYYKWYFDAKMRDCYSNNVTNHALGEKYDLSKRLRKGFMHYRPYENMKRMREAFYLIPAYSQIGEYDTKDSLKNGILSRDPMQTVKIINMCYKIPIYCYANADYERRLIRVGMKGIVPDDIRKNMFQRGRQSGDNSYRLGKSWEKVKEKWVKKVYSDDVMRYLDKDKIDALLKEYANGIDKADMASSYRASNLYSFGIFIEKIKKFC
ncbi:asparagine synthase-related protein [Butyrivibrio sp. YAB3001]|uniref:asparagine synthase-related protein n=1 Tax=Butyrivibrio sp. YAB3001 TaxID=1520812 RepID=UPI0008F68978|nr:asparagine synthase-related protein [Butyrivibrio sp. YAB3001]SFB84191.1 asparagine synthase (glutamine-hydrolysing) [Butyrivibrio sp. YAB3001]